MVRGGRGTHWINIQGMWADVPKGKPNSARDLIKVVKSTSGNSISYLHSTYKTGGFAGSRWTLYCPVGGFEIQG
jgi:hypothetical protein